MNLPDLSLFSVEPSMLLKFDSFIGNNNSAMNSKTNRDNELKDINIEDIYPTNLPTSP